MRFLRFASISKFFSLILQEDDSYWTPAKDELPVDEPDASSTD